MTTTLIDGIKAVSLQNGIVRIDTFEGGPNNEERVTGTLLVPANRAGQIVGALTQGQPGIGKEDT